MAIGAGAVDRWPRGGILLRVPAGLGAAGAARAHGWWHAVGDVAVIGAAALPVSIGVAIFKYGCMTSTG